MALAGHHSPTSDRRWLTALGAVNEPWSPLAVWPRCSCGQPAPVVMLTTRKKCGSMAATATGGGLGRVVRQRPSRFTAESTQSRATQPRCIDVPDWVTTSAVQPTLWGVVIGLIVSVMVASWHPIGATLAEGRSGTLSVQPSPVAQWVRRGVRFWPGELSTNVGG